MPKGFRYVVNRSSMGVRLASLRILRNESFSPNVAVCSYVWRIPLPSLPSAGTNSRTIICLCLRSDEECLAIAEIASHSHQLENKRLQSALTTCILLI